MFSMEFFLSEIRCPWRKPIFSRSSGSHKKTHNKRKYCWSMIKFKHISLMATWMEIMKSMAQQLCWFWYIPCSSSRKTTLLLKLLQFTKVRHTKTRATEIPKAVNSLLFINIKCVPLCQLELWNYVRTVTTFNLHSIISPYLYA